MTPKISAKRGSKVCLALAIFAFAACARAAFAFDLMNPNSWPFIPVPEIATDPNGGTTMGVLPVLLNNEGTDQIKSIFAPDINYNTTLGAGGNFRYLAYPSADRQWYAVAGGQQNIQRLVDLDFQDGRERKSLWSFEGRFYFEKDPTERFFGLGNHSHHGNETNYTSEQLYGEGVVGLNLNEHLQFSLTERPRYVRISQGAFSLPYLGSIFPHQKGINGGTEVLTQGMVTYDTRNSVDIPRNGALVRGFYGIADREFMSSYSYNRFGGEVRHYYSFGDRFTLASHLFAEFEPAGNEMPFWAQARLGGDESLLQDQQPLRGYGTGRYVDNNLAVANIELRTRVWKADLFGTHGILEVAPFAEAGRVAHDVAYNPLSSLHPVAGVGFRGIAEPFVVGFVDLGYGGEGATVFTGINYPF